MRHVSLLPVLAAFAAGVPSQVQTGSMTGLHTGDQFGAVIVPFHDIDGDGTVDLLIGCPAWDNGAASNAGRVELRSGRTGALLRTNNGTNTNDYFGSSIAVLADLNGDGVPEYLVGVPLADNGGPDCGAVKVFSGATGGLMRNHYLSENNAQLGTAVVALPDIDSDGVPDYAAGAPQNTNVSPVGRVFFYSGRTGNVIRTRYGFSSYGLYGATLTVVGDVTGNGTNCLAIGSPHEQVLQAYSAGTVDIVSLSTFVRLTTLTGSYAGDHFGSTIEALGDIDGDGRADLAVSSPDSSYGTVRILRIDGTVIRTHYGSTAGSRAGLGLGCVGDVDFDGVPDYGIGEPFAGSGDARIFSGRTGAELAHITAGSSGAMWGRTIVAVGDTDHDAFGEFAISMPNQGNGEMRFYSLSSPMSFHYFGTACGISPTGPSLGMSAGGLVGSLLSLRPDTTPIASGFGTMLYGWSDTVAQGYSLPLSLAPFGLPGCQLLVSPDLQYGVLQNTFRHQVDVMIPRMPELVGKTLYAQYALFHSGGTAFTGGVSVRLGTPF